MKGSSTAPADFFVPRAKLFYDDVLFGNSVLIRKAIYCSLIDFLTICDGPLISTDIILLFCFFCLYVFYLPQLPSRKIDCTFSGKMVCCRSTKLSSHHDLPYLVIKGRIIAQHGVHK